MDLCKMAWTRLWLIVMATQLLGCGQEHFRVTDDSGVIEPDTTTGGGDVDADTDSDTDSDADSETASDVDSETGDSDTESGDTDTDSETDSESATDGDTATETDTEWDTETDTDSETDSESDTFVEGTAGLLQFTVATGPTELATYEPNHALAVWIEDQDGKFVRTCVKYGLLYDHDLKHWVESTDKNVVDAITGATIREHGTQTVEWNGRNVDGRVVEDGEYRLCVELTDNPLTSSYQSYAWTKGVETANLSPADEQSFAEMALSWVPEFDTESDSETDTGFDHDCDQYPDPAVAEICRLWGSSPHADPTAKAFTHWNEEDPPLIPAQCAKCHSPTGYLSALVGIEADVAPGEVLGCRTCHDPEAASVETAVFPSGATVVEETSAVRCLGCHQGMASTTSLDDQFELADGGVLEDDEIPSEGTIEFVSPHYAAAGAVQLGREVESGYQYSNQLYDGRFPHGATFQRCPDCHDVHTTKVQYERCAACHGSVSAQGIREIRMPGSTPDYDGDGDWQEGIAQEIDGLAERLLQEMKQYAQDHPVAAPICYATQYPYYFSAGNGDPEVCDPADFVYLNRYADWTPRLLKAAYNYQLVQSESGGFVHHGKYLIQLLYDSIADMGGDIAALARDDGIHFSGTSAANRHWYGEPLVEADCARCHTTEGFDFYVTYGLDPTVDVRNAEGLACANCHEQGKTRFVEQLIFLSGVLFSNDELSPDSSFLCLTCHQGRAARATIDAAIDQQLFQFKNIHSGPTGAVMYGADAAMGYQYDSQLGNYQGRFEHHGSTSAQCKFCHALEGGDHRFAARLTESCGQTDCHTELSGNDDIRQIRKNRPLDYDGDGDVTETLAAEITGLGQLLYAQIQATAPGICYAEKYPYWFEDDNGTPGECDEADYVYPDNPYTAWNAELMRAAHNYQIYRKEHGAWAHNTNYIAQLLIDSIAALGGETGNLNRP